MQHFSLSQRVKIAFVICFAVLSVISVSLIFGAAKAVEDHIFEKQLQDKVSEYYRLLKAGQTPSLPDNIRVFSSVAELPEYLRGYIDTEMVGLDEISHPDGLGYHYAIVDTHEYGRQIFLYDVNPVELSDDVELLIVNVIVFAFIILTLIMFALFQLVVKKALAPMYQLISQVKHQSLKPDKTLHYHYPNDNELGLLNQSLMDYSQRIEEFVRREQEFTSFASHELRTPLMVIKGAAELLQLQDTPGLKKPLARIKRAVVSMEDTTEILLALSREEHNHQEQKVQANELLQDVIDSFEASLSKHGKTLNLSGCFSEHLTLEKIPAAMIFSNLIKNAIAHSSSNAIHIELKHHSLVLQNDIDSHSAIGTQHIDKRGNYGLGRLIMQRLCSAYGWAIEEGQQKRVYRACVLF